MTAGRGFTLTEGALVFLGLALLLGLACWCAGFAIQQAQMINLGSVEMTRHAENGHLGQPNARSISEKIDGGKCPNLSAYVCPREGTVKIMCSEPGASATDGLIMGVSNAAEVVAAAVQPQYTKVITGYRARNSYWSGNLASCFPIPLDWLP